MTALKDRFWAKVAFKEFIRHFRKLSPEQIVSDVMASMDALEDLDDEGDSFGSKMVRWSMERVEQYPMAQANGQKGGRPRKSITADGDTSDGSQDIHDGSNAAHMESGTSATISQDAAHREAADDSKAPTSCNPMRRGPQNEAPAHGFSGGRTAQGTMSRSTEAAAQSGKSYDQEPDRRISTDEALDLMRIGVMAQSPAPTRKGSAMPSDVGEVYAFASEEGLDSVDAYECWSATIARDGKTADGKKVRNWKAYVRRWCATRAEKRRTA